MRKSEIVEIQDFVDALHGYEFIERSYKILRTFKDTKNEDIEGACAKLSDVLHQIEDMAVGGSNDIT